jgi:tetratricopeptide (TPR) repeat protein
MKLRRPPRRVPPAAVVAVCLLGCEEPPPERPVLDRDRPVSATDCLSQRAEVERLVRREPERRPEQVQQIQLLAAMYDRARAAGVAPAQLQGCREALRDLTHEIALLLHQRAQRDKDQEARVLTGELYRIFLERFADDPRAYAVGFYNGELLWTMERWREAAVQYQWVVERDPGGKLAAEAAYGALLAWKNVLESARQGQGHGQGQGDTAKPEAGAAPRAPTEDERRLLAAMDTYLRVVPDAPERVSIQYRRARMHYDWGRFEEAIPMFQVIVERHPQHELAVYSANLLLDALNARGRTGEVLRWTETFLATPSLMKDAQLARQMRTLRSDGLEAVGLQAQRSGQLLRCGRSLVAAAEAAPQHPRQRERLAGGVRCLRAAGQLVEARRAQQRLAGGAP